MAVIAKVSYPAEIGHVESVTLSDTATPTAPNDTPGEVDSASITAGQVDNDIYIDGRDITLDVNGRVKTMNVLDMEHDGALTTSASLTGKLARFVTGDINIPPMQNGAVGAALDYLMQKTGERRVSNQYAAGVSTNMLCASLRGHSAIFDVASGKEVKPQDESSLKIVGSPWRPSQDYRQGFHTHFETFVDDTVIPYAPTPWNWSGRPIFGNLNLDGGQRHVIKFIAQKATYSNVATLSARLGTSVDGTGLSPTISVSINFAQRKVYCELKDRGFTAATSDFTVDGSINLNNPFVFAVSFIYTNSSTLPRLTVDYAVSNLSGTVSTVNAPNINRIFVGKDFARIGGLTQAPLSVNYVMANTLVYDQINPAWTDWWKLIEIPSAAQIVGTKSLGGPVKRTLASGWDYLSQVLSTYGWEIRADGDQIIVSETGARRIEIRNTGVVSRSVSRPDVSAYDISYSQNITNGYPSFTLAYSNEALGEVDTANVVYFSDVIDGQFHYLYQPDVSGVLGNPSKSVYNVLDSEERFVSSKEWIESGASVRVRLSEDGSGIDVVLAGPTTALQGRSGPYKIKNFKVSGSGYATSESSMRIVTGVPRMGDALSASTVSPPTAMGVSAVAQIASKMNDFYAVQEELSFDCDIFTHEEINGSNPVGALFEYNNVDYRITRYEQNDLSGTITARPHVTIKRLVDEWGTATLGQLTQYWGLKQYSYSDISKEPLEGYNGS